MAKILADTKFTIEITAQEITQNYLDSIGMVAIPRILAEHLAKCDGGVASHWMVYDPRLDRYRMSPAARDLLCAGENQNGN